MNVWIVWVMVLPWETVWSVEKEADYGKVLKVWLRVFTDDDEKVTNAELFFEKETRKRTYWESIGLDLQRLLELCEALEPIHTKLLQQFRSDL